MSCRDEILDCVRRITSQRGSDEFTIEEIIRCMRTCGTEYRDSTIRTHISSRLCLNAPKHHAVRYPDFERTARGTYRLTTAGGAINGRRSRSAWGSYRDQP
jgi:hypothetical protein